MVPFYFYHFGIPLKSENGNTTQYLGIHAIPMLRTVNDITFLLLTINSKDHGHKTETDFRLMTLTQILTEEYYHHDYDLIQNYRHVNIICNLQE